MNDITITLQSFSPWLSQLVHFASQKGHRAAVVLAGDRSWSSALVNTPSGFDHMTRCLWVGEQSPGSYEHKVPGMAHTVLGGEYDVVVLDAWSGLDVDDFGALVGVVRAGGVFFLLCPPFSDWPNYKDPAAEKMHVMDDSNERPGQRYIRRLIRIMQLNEDIFFIEQQGVLPELELVQTNNAAPVNQTTADQLKAIEAITTMAHTEREGAVALVADRGRGKSSALGMAALRLSDGNDLNILLTAPRYSAVQQVYEHAGKVGDEQLEFVAPDELIRTPRHADLLMVDEAAAIPVQVLRKLLQLYPHVVFATTVHGYEGSGRGFELRFTRLLDEIRPGWSRIQMKQPVRWAEHDPLEKFAFSALLLNAQAPPIQDNDTVNPVDCDYVVLDREALIQDEGLLNELFGLLVMAHYRTRPFDLRYLLDAPGVELHALLYKQHAVAVCMLSREGGFDTATSTDIFAGLRRPRGHLLAQSMAAHCGIEHGAVHHYARIVRIAVHPQLQGQGLGSRLLEELVTSVSASEVIALGTSFAADERVLHFWHQHAFKVVHLGVKQEHTTGSYPVLMLRAINDEGSAILNEAGPRFTKRYQVLRESVFSDLDQPLVDALSQAGSEQDIPLSGAINELLGFVYANRGFELSLYAIRSYLSRFGMSQLEEKLDEQACDLFRNCVLGSMPVSEAVKVMGLKGRREAIAMLKAGLDTLIEAEAEETMLSQRDRLLSLEKEL